MYSPEIHFQNILTWHFRTIQLKHKFMFVTERI